MIVSYMFNNFLINFFYLFCDDDDDNICERMFFNGRKSEFRKQYDYSLKIFEWLFVVGLKWSSICHDDDEEMNYTLNF